MKQTIMLAIAVFFLLVAGSSSSAQQEQVQTPPPAQQKIPIGSKVFIATMGGFEAPLKKAIKDKKVPLEIVEQREQAEYEISGASESKKASTAKKVILGSWHSDEEASIKVASLKTGEIVYAYSVHKQDSTHGQRSTAEACAKHLKDEAIVSR